MINENSSCNQAKYFFRGKGDNHRLGHGATEEHIRFPKQVEALINKKVRTIITLDEGSILI